MSNILNAIIAIVNDNFLSVNDSPDSSVPNRAIKEGAALEDYVKDAFAGCIGEKNKLVRSKSINKAFSYCGSKNFPPDAMLKQGDAIEIKKIKSLQTVQLQLNSSYPKNKLYSSNPKICKSCKECEKWDVKDIIYVVGHVDDEKLYNIMFVYGDLYCDSSEIYENIESNIKGNLTDIEDVDIVETQELGRINKVDHLGITDLRIRGMWLIKSPFKQFEYLTANVTESKFKLVAIIPTEKYNSFTNVVEFEKYCNEKNIAISDVEIENPCNPAALISSKLIIYSR